MSGQHFRFLQAGAFELDQPLAGLTEIPEPLTELLIDAPFSAAQKVFDAAIEERVDFVVLNGDLIDLARPSARHGPPIPSVARRACPPNPRPPSADLLICYSSAR